jgi:hypothetical protein
MAKHSPSVIQLLRTTAQQLEISADYQWGHMGSCNCGFLARNITHLPKNEIHSLAMQRTGDWSEQLNDYCPGSGLLMDNIISDMITFGFETDDLKHLERLSDRTILQSLPPGKRNLRHNVKADVIEYIKAWSILLESKLLQEIRLPLPDAMPAEV